MANKSVCTLWGKDNKWRRREVNIWRKRKCKRRAQWRKRRWAGEALEESRGERKQCRRREARGWRSNGEMPQDKNKKFNILIIKLKTEAVNYACFVLSCRAKSQVCVGCGWQIMYISSVTTTKVPSSKAAEPLKWINVMKTILQVPQSQTSSSLGPPAPWRHIPERPRRNAAVRYQPGCPPAKVKQRCWYLWTIWGMFSMKWGKERCKLRDNVLHRAGVTLSSLLKGWGASPALHNTSLSLCHTFSWLPATDIKKNKKKTYLGARIIKLLISVRNISVF